MTVQAVQSRPTPATSSGRAAAWASASGTAARAAAHHWPASCSAQAGCGWNVSSGATPKPRQAPAASNRAARTLWVPTSRPRNSGEAVLMAAEKVKEDRAPGSALSGWTRVYGRSHQVTSWIANV